MQPHLMDHLMTFKKKLEVQFHLCKRADAEVTRLEAENELALLANPINQLRRQLEPGAAVSVCAVLRSTPVLMKLNLEAKNS